MAREWGDSGDGDAARGGDGLESSRIRIHPASASKSPPPPAADCEGPAITKVPRRSGEGFTAGGAASPPVSPDWEELGNRAILKSSGDCWSGDPGLRPRPSRLTPPE